MVNNIQSIVLFVLFFVVSGIGFSADVNIQKKFENANNLYVAKDFSGAINQYHEIISGGYESAEVLYNLGNAYFRVGKLGYSILYYEKALKIAPKDEDILHNLALANLRTVDKIETLPEFFLFEWWEGLLNFFTLKEWIFLGLTIYILLILCIGGYFLTSGAGAQKLSLMAGAVILISLFLTVSLIILKYNREINELRGIITANTTVVKAAPEESAGDAFIVHEGLKFKIEDRLNKWVKIRLIDGKVGWIKAIESEVI